ncbi:SWIRM domain protein (macronuclear) [Tetrahymena thermophila SB210]|uniref:SWIRM domain protein n=1 Tax=Tetrahymena thermophila (strain SB210) TaxID=312017 RepID=I7LZU3_TETTS|nr:SWIRM domain protein [Tetrahymena thermophila SB210]EAR84927.1 SWIRM domain protein [Tetrahymena thermophila SB210]|eukprot:XP_001032590.1 SWIRM domain protein [Tetrahymena thermophila SB210]
MKQKKNQIVINLLKLPNNSYQVIDQEQEDTKPSQQQTSSSKKGGKSQVSKQQSQQPPLSPESSNPIIPQNPPPTNLSLSAQQTPQTSQNQSVQQNSQQANSQIANQQSQPQNSMQGGSNLQAPQAQVNQQVQQAQPPVQQPVAPQVQQPPKANPTFIPTAAPPSLIIRGEENSKDIFPYTSFAQEKYHQSMGNGGQNMGENKSEKSQKKYQVVLPSCSHWFEMEKIHQIEKESLPEFFQGKPSKTPEIYKRYRNFIVALYRENPRVYLTATACRRNLAGDVCAILRVHAFLEHWGIINFNCDPKLTPQSILLSKPTLANQSIYKFTNQSKKIDLLDQDRDLFQEGGEGDLVFNSIKLLSKNQRPICDFCGVICGLVWFQQKQVQENQPCMVLCIKCYTEGNYPSFLSDRDFEKSDLINKLSSNDSKQNLSQRPWTPQETHKLLEKIEEYKENWDEIVKSLDGRTREEIILHFLRLPLKNISQVRLFENEDDNNIGRQPYEEIADDEPTVFSDFSNPLIQHIAIFKSLLDKHKQKKQSIKASAKSSQPQKIEQKEENVEGGTNSQIKEEDEIQEEQKQQNQSKEGQDMEVEIAEQAPSQSAVNGVAKGETVIQEEVEEQVQVQDSLKKKEDKRLGLIEEVSNSNADDLLEIENITKERAKKLQEREESKIKKLVQSLIYCQLSKLESKLNYLEEYEKLIWYERNQLEVTQSNHIAETVSLAYRRNEFNKEFTRTYQEQHRRQMNQQQQPGMPPVPFQNQGQQVPPIAPITGTSPSNQAQQQQYPQQNVPNSQPVNASGYQQQYPQNQGGSQQNIPYAPNQAYHKPPAQQYGAPGYQQQPPIQNPPIQPIQQQQQAQIPNTQQNYQHYPQGIQNQGGYYGNPQRGLSQESTPTNSNPMLHQNPQQVLQTAPVNQAPSSQSIIGGPTGQHNLSSQPQIPVQAPPVPQGQYDSSQGMNIEEQNYFSQNDQQEPINNLGDYPQQTEPIAEYTQADQGYQQDYSQQMYDQTEKIDQ